MKLSRLLPINAVRERRAQHLLHQLQHAHELAVSAQEDACSKLEQLQISQRSALQSTLDNAEMSAARAHALLERAETARLNMIPARKNLESKQEEAERARLTEQKAHGQYVRVAQLHKALQELSSLERSRCAKVARLRSETDADDEFVLSLSFCQKYSSSSK